MKRGALMAASAGVATMLAGAVRAGDADHTGSGGWLDSIDITGRIEIGATFNPSRASSTVNFGQLFTDKADQLVLNQVAMTAQRPPDPASPNLNFGFMLQGMYGLDSQFTHFQGLGDQSTTSRNSFDFLQGYVAAHAPAPFARGVDVKLGLFVTPMGAEAIDPTADFFYSRSYIFNFGLPFKHTGVLTDSHLNSWTDIYLGYTTGVNASLGPGGGYNDGQAHIIGGFGLNFDRLTVLALTHIGPQDPPALLPAGVNVHGQLRYLNDAVITWRATDRLTSVTELNYIRDDGLHAEGGGIAEYVTYPLSSTVTAGVRAEFWRDAQGVFVAGYPGNLDFINAEEGRPNGAYNAGPATYGEFTFGLNIKPKSLPWAVDGLTVRPEIRYDRTLAGGAPFGARPGGGRDQVTVGVDVVIPVNLRRPPGADREPRDTTAESEQSPTTTRDVTGGKDVASRSHLIVGDPLSTPVSHALFSAAQLDVLRPRTLADLSGLAANLTIGGAGGGPGAAVVTVRGLGSTNADAGGIPAVALVVDGVVVGAASGQHIEVFDADLVDFLRGPAGAELGLNTIGGAIDVQRGAPTRRWGLDVEYGLEQGYHANNERTVLNAPVGETAGLRLSASHQERAGYLNNVYTGDGLYGRDELTTGNLQFDWSVAPRLEAAAELTLIHRDGDGNPLALGDPLDARLFGPGLLAATPGLRFNNFGAPFVAGITQPLGAFQTANDTPDRDLQTEQIYSLRLAWASPVGRISSITAFLRQNEETDQDGDGGCSTSDPGDRACSVTANPLVGSLSLLGTRKYDQLSERLALESALGRSAEFLAGLSWTHDDVSAVRLDRTGPQAETAGPPSGWQVSDRTDEDRSLFARLVARPIGRLVVGGGVTVIDDSLTFSEIAAQNGLPVGAVTGSERSTRVLTDIAASFDLGRQTEVYARRTVGFRPGGLAPDTTLSQQVFGREGDTAAYGPETDATYEIGVKAISLADGLTATVNGFINDDRDHQMDETVLTPGFGPGYDTTVVNLPKVVIRGAELTLDYRPPWVRGLSLTADGGWQDARITNGRVPAVQVATGPSALAGPAGATTNLTGTPLTDAPRFGAAVRGDYGWSIGPGLVVLAMDFRWTDSYALATLGAQADNQRAFGLVDVSTSYSRGRYRIVVSAKNLTNQIYFSSAQPWAFTHAWGDPRTVVVTLQAGF